MNRGNAQRSSFRGVFAESETDESYNPSYWKKATKCFPNGVPRFLSKDEAVAFTREHCETGSNPDDPDLRHNISTLIDWDQIEKHLLPKILEYNAKWPAVYLKTDRLGMVANNRYMDPKSLVYTSCDEASDSSEGISSKSKTSGDQLIPLSDPANGRNVYQKLISRLDLSVHKMMTSYSTINTLKYLFYHMKCGIYVMIRNNEVVIFCPFVNRHYKNNWGNALQVDSPNGTLKTYYHDKLSHYREENILDPSSWWANGNIICNEDDRTETAKEHSKISTSQWWGDQFLFQLKDMLAETCAQRVVPDCEFFLNKRDYPQLKFHLQENSTASKGVPQNSGRGFPVEPYGFIYDRDDLDPTQDIPLTRHAYKSYAPIMSFYTSDRFADIPIPPSEDWEAATGEVFPPSFIYESKKVGDEIEIITAAPRDLFTAANLKKFEVPWGEKVPTAFFRGTATGGGVTTATNQRLHIAEVCYLWSSGGYPNLCGRLGTVGASSGINQTAESSKLNNSAKGKNIKMGVKNEKSNTKKEVKLEVEDEDENDEEEEEDFIENGDNDDDHCDTAINDKTKSKLSRTNQQSYSITDDSYYPFLDAKITGWNIRDKKIAKGKMTYLRKANFPFEGDRKKNFVEIYKQGTYKYVLYIEGHCAACRYGFMMQLGSVILKVESTCVADQMWYFPLLVPFRDHVPVKSDLSDLEEKIRWCRDNDDKCREIARTAQELYKMYVSREGILDYMQAVCVEVSKRWKRAPVWADNPPLARPSPSINRWHEKGIKCAGRAYCSTCEQMMANDEKAKLSSRSGNGADGTEPLSQADKMKAEMKERLRLKKEKNIQMATKERDEDERKRRRKEGIA